MKKIYLFLGITAFAGSAIARRGFLEARFVFKLQLCSSDFRQLRAVEFLNKNN